MRNQNSQLRKFGKFRLDTEKKVLWFADEPVNLALKEIELLCVLTENGGEVITKDEILNKVWADSFVEESNLSRHIYRLRKTFEEFGESDLIQTVPRRGYRFTGEIHENGSDELIIERHSISRTLVEELEDSVEPKVKTIPAQSLQTKSLLLPIVVCLILLTTLFGYYFYNRKPIKPENIKSIAVLPLKALNENESNQLLPLALTDSLISRLGSLNRFAVRPFSAVEDFGKNRQDALKFGEELKVEAVLEGTIQQSKGRLRVNLRLLDVRDGRQIWTGSFDEIESDIFKLQDLVSAQVTNALVSRITSDDQKILAKRYTENKQAYLFYLRGRHFFDKRTIENYYRAIEEYQLAVSLDSNYALAYTGIADAYSLLANNSSEAEREKFYEQATQYVTKALALDESLSEAHASLGWIKRTSTWDWQASENHFKRSLELNPNNANAHRWYGLLLTGIGRTKEGIEELRKAQELNPLSTIYNTHLALALFFDRQYDESEIVIRKNLELEPNHPGSLRLLINLLIIKQRYNEAWSEIERFPPAKEHEFHVKTMKAIVFYKTGKTNEAIDLLKKLETEYREDKTSYHYLAMVYSLMGNHDKALIFLEQALDIKDDRLVWIKVEPNFIELHHYPRFQEILRKMNLL